MGGQRSFTGRSALACVIFCTVVLLRFAVESSAFAAEPDDAAVATWPTHMHDDARSGVADTSLKLPLQAAWVYQTALPPSPAWPPPARQNLWANQTDLKARITFDHAFTPVSDGKRVYFGSSSDDQLRCLDLQTGKLLWSTFAGGPIRLAPTIYEDHVYFGCDDGCVYCLDATSGKIVWQVAADAAALGKAVPKIPGNSRMISPLPVRSGVIVDGDHVRFAAGIFPEQGVWQFGANRKTGEIVAKGQLKFSAQGYMRRDGEQIRIAQGRAPEVVLDKANKRGEAPAVNVAPTADFPFVAIVAGETKFCGGDGKVAAIDLKTAEVKWQVEVDGEARSLAVAGKMLLIGTSTGKVYAFAEADAAPEQPQQIRESTSNFEPSSIDDTTKNWVTLRDALPDSQGWALLIGDQAALLARVLREKGFRVVVLVDEEKIEDLRRDLATTGDYGQICVLGTTTGSTDSLPVGDMLFNVVVSTYQADEPDGTLTEILRVLRPEGGKAFLFADGPSKNTEPPKWLTRIPEGWVKDRGNPIQVERPQLEGAGEWRHQYATAGNTSCSADRFIGTKLTLQWFGPPGPQNMIDRHLRTVSPIYVGGHLLVPGNERIYGVDAYNGTVRWETEVADSRRVAVIRDGGSMSADDERLYVAAKQKCIALSLKTGKQDAVFEVPSGSDGKPREWGYTAVLGDTLVGSASQVGGSYTEFSRDQIDAAYYDARPIVTSDALFGFDAETGEQRWIYRTDGGGIVNQAITAGDGKLFIVQATDATSLKADKGRIRLKDLMKDGSKVICFDSQSGEELWRQDHKLAAAEHNLYGLYADKTFVLVTSFNRDGKLWFDITALDAASGKEIWHAEQNQSQGTGGSHGEQDRHPVIVSGTLHVEPFAYDLKSGKQKEGWKLPRLGHGCGSVSASENACYFRAGNPTTVDLKTGERAKVTAVSRPGCLINIIPAGGLLLIPEASSGCTCNFAVQSSLAYRPTDVPKMPARNVEQQEVDD